MSIWDRYLAPSVRQQDGQDASAETAALQKRNDATAVSREDATASSRKDTTASSRKDTTAASRTDANGRRRRQDTLFFGGIVFTCLSVLVTRRSLQRKRLPYPKTFTPSNTPPPPAEGSLDATEALGLASLNVFSLAMVAAGGAMKWFDIADVEDLREGVRRGVGYDVYGGDSEGDKEIEAWIADVLSRKDVGGGLDLRGSIANKLKELEDMEKRRNDGGEKR